MERDEQGRARRVWLSAVTGAGIDLLRQALREHMTEGVKQDAEVNEKPSPLVYPAASEPQCGTA